MVKLVNSAISPSKHRRNLELILFGLCAVAQCILLRQTKACDIFPQPEVHIQDAGSWGDLTCIQFLKVRNVIKDVGKLFSIKLLFGSAQFKPGECGDVFYFFNGEFHDV